MRMCSLRIKISLVLKSEVLAREGSAWRLVKAQHGCGVKRVRVGGCGGVSAAIIAPGK